jgi:hypothetical protein
VEYLLIFEDVVQSLLYMCPYDVFSLILTEPHTNQTRGPIQTVGVFSVFLVTFSNSYQLELHNKTWVALANL